MCIHLYMHNTTSRHDTRFLSVINPATGYTVYSPFQDPYVQPSQCSYPCHLQDVVPHEACPWHGWCCRLETMEVCRDHNPQSCTQWIKYHHFCETPEGRDRRFLREYFKYDPSLLVFSGHFFKAGVELALASHYQRQVQRRLEYLGHNVNADGGSGFGDGSEEDQAALYSQLSYFSRVANCATEVLGQFARFWDAQAAWGLFPHRPGREGIAELNLVVLEDCHLRAAGWEGNDDGAVQWPDYVEAWPNFADLLPFPEDPSLVSWCSYPGGIEPSFIGNNSPSDPFHTADLVLGQQDDSSLLFGLLDPELAQQGLDVSLGDIDLQYLLSASAEVHMDMDMDMNIDMGMGLPEQQQDSSESEVDDDGSDDSSSARQYPTRTSKRTEQRKKRDGKASPPIRSGSPVTSSLSHSDSPPVGSPKNNNNEEKNSARSTSGGEDENEKEDDNDDVADAEQPEEESDDGDDGGVEIENEKEEIGPDEYPVEALVGHKPKRAARHDVRQYKVRWAGKWPSRQKETWEHRSNIAPMIIREYWLKHDEKRALREQVGKVRRGR